MLAREEKPLIVSMGDLAASGGYYIAMPGHVIVAQPGTLTGSIGIYTGKIAYGGTLEKLGVGVESVAEGKLADINSPVRPFTAAERAKIEEQVQAFYEQFVTKVAEARKTHAREDRRGRAGTRLDRPPGQGPRPGRRARRPDPGHRHRQGAGQDRGGERRRDRRLPAEAVDLRGAQPAARAVGRGRGAEHARAVPPGRAAGAAPGAGAGAAAAAPRAPGADALRLCSLATARTRGRLNILQT